MEINTLIENTNANRISERVDSSKEMVGDRKISKLYLEQLTKLIKSTSTQINFFSKHKSCIIKNEINRYVKKYLKNAKFQDYNVLDLTNLWTYVNIPTIDPMHPNEIFNNNTERKITGWNLCNYKRFKLLPRWRGSEIFKPKSHIHYRVLNNS